MPGAGFRPQVWAPLGCYISCWSETGSLVTSSKWSRTSVCPEKSATGEELARVGSSIPAGGSGLWFTACVPGAREEGCLYFSRSKCTWDAYPYSLADFKLDWPVGGTSDPGQGMTQAGARAGTPKQVCAYLLVIGRAGDP